MEVQNLYSLIKPFEGGVRSKSIPQLIISLFSYLGLIGLMFFLLHLEVSYWIVLLPALPASGFQVRLFIILHDCSHGSYFPGSRACSAVGSLCGLFTFTPYQDWRHSHAVHHATVGNLERRGIGDVWTMTVSEYREAGLFKKIRYRIFRNPLFLFGIAPAFLFLVLFRLPHVHMSRKDLASILFTDFCLFLILFPLSLGFGFLNVLMVLFPPILLSSIWGTWLFFIQHQFKEVYWSHSAQWDRYRAAMEGSSFYSLPHLLRWFSGNIGYHHIHHLNPRIPNYNLRRCYNEIAELREITPITLLTGFKSMFLQLWDEKQSELVSYRAARRP